MADPKAQAPELLEAQKKLEAIRGAFGKGVGQAKSYLEQFSAAIRARLEEAEAEAQKAQEMAEVLEAHLAHPGAADLQTRMKLRHRTESAYAALLSMELEADLEAIADLAKLGQVETLSPELVPQLRVVQSEPAYRRAAIEQDLALAAYHLFRERHAFAVLRQAAGQGFALPADDPAAFQGPLASPEARAEAVEALRQAMRSDPATFQLVGQFATQIEEAEALAAWGEEAVRSLAALPPEAMLRSLDDPDWRKLNGAVVALGAMGERAAGHPLLSAWLPAPKALPPAAVPLPEHAPKPSNLMAGLSLPA